MRKRIISMALVVALLCGLVIASTAFASTPVTLYTGGGAIYATDWTSNGNGKYTGSGILPTPIMPGANFAGWYTDINLTTGVVQPGSDATAGAYYAKWALDNSGDNGKMAYWLTSYGGTANGYKTGDYLRAFFANGGFYTATDDAPANAGGTADYSGTRFAFGPNTFTQRGDTDIYLARTMSLEGNFVRLSYHVQNRGSANSAAFWLGAAADSKLGENDKVPLKKTTTNGQTWLSMVDKAAGNELRLYTTSPSVTTPDRLWWGGYWDDANSNALKFTGNTFNNGQDGKYKDGIDSAFAFSWNVPTLAPGETQSYSVLLGVGSSSGFNTAYKLSYNLNGGSGTVPTDSNRYPIGAEVAVTSTSPARAGYEFLYWSTSPDSNGASARAGGKLPIYGDTTLYAIWQALPQPASVTVTEDGSHLGGKAVTLYSGGILAFTLSETGEVYTHDAVRPGNYNIYVDGIPTGKTITIGATAGSAEVVYASAELNLLLDGNAWPGHSAALYLNNVKVHDLAYKDGVYSLGMLPTGAEFQVRVDGAVVGTLTTGTPLTLDYFTAKVAPEKDGALWTDAAVKAGSTALSLSGGVYTAPLPAGSYDVTVNGTNIGSISDNTSLAADFYTVTFFDGAAAFKSPSPQQPQIVLKDTTATAPASSPAHPGGTAVFSKWVDSLGVEFDFATEITGTTKLYTAWSTPVVVPGEPARQSNTTYKLPDLKITGYNSGQTITGFTVVLNNGSVADSGNGTKTGSGTANLTVSFGPAKSITDTEAYLKALTFTVSGTTQQTVTITVYGS